MPENYVIAVDLGGTNLRVGTVNREGEIAFREKEPSNSHAGSAVVLGRVAEMVRRAAAKVQEKVIGLSLGFPGIINAETGVVHQSPHFPDWKDLEVLSYFKKEFPWPVVVDNDANHAALGEGWKGAGKGLKNFIMLTFGTGIGGGIVLNGEVLRGDRGFAGEIGHIGIDPEGPQCGCGGRGCLELYASAGGLKYLIKTSDDVQGREKLIERLGGVIERVSIRGLYEAARDGDLFASRTFRRMGYYLGIGLNTLLNTLGVETFILGGGIAEAWDFFIEPTRKELTHRAYREAVKQVQIKKTLLGDDAGLVGGASRFFRRGDL